MIDKTTLGVSDTFREYIEALVEEVVINGEPFEAQKKWLRKYSEAEGVDYVSLEKNLEDLFQIIEEWRASQSKSSQIALKVLATDCFLSEEEMGTLLSTKGNSRRGGGLFNGHEYVDLGLPSGTMWAMCNVGATKPEEYGDYFAWGETGTKHIYDESAYKYAHGVLNKLTKYCGKSDYGSNGYTDSLAELQRSDDPASSWGSGWCTPTKAQWDELLRNTTSRWTTQNGVEGRLFTSKKNDQTLFLPAAGCRGHSSLNFPGINGYYWSSSLCTDNPDGALSFNFYNSGYCGIGSSVRSFGRSVRAAHSAC